MNNNEPVKHRNRVAVSKQGVSRSVKPTRSFSKVDATYGELLTLAHRLGPHAKMPTVRTLREEMSVSQATLDAALARLEGQNVVVRRQGSGVYVSPRLKQRNIALLCNPEYFLAYGTSPFWGLLLKQIRQMAARNEASLSLQFLRPYQEADLDPVQDSSPVPEALRADFKEGTVHGVISIGTPHSVARWIESQGIPVVAYAGAAQYLITQSSETLIQMGVAELVRQGCRDILPWLIAETTDGTTSTVHPVYPVYRGAALAHGLSPYPPFPSRVREAMTSFNSTKQSFIMADEIFRGRGRLERKPDGIIFSDDMQAQGVLMALYRLGIKPGRDIKVASHANADSSTLLAWQDEITRLEYDPTLLVKLLFETLDSLMNGEEPSWIPQAQRVPEWQYLIEPTLIVPTGQ